MGGVLSATKGLRDALEDTSQSATGLVEIATPSRPPRPSGGGGSHRHRLLPSDLDPRSPSDNLLRTPIAVVATPLKPEVLERVAGGVGLVDPRSPSTEITRTPIVAPSGEQEVERVADPRSPTYGITRTPIISEGTEQPGATDCSFLTGGIVEKQDGGYLGSIPNLEAIPPILSLDSEDGMVNRSLSEPDLSKEDSLVLRHRDGSVDLSFRESTPKKRVKVSSQKLSHDDLTTRSMMIKDRSPLKILGGNQRSPLAVRNSVDVNSPRAIVQRKQATKLGLTRPHNRLSMQNADSSNRHQAREGVDKENRL